MSISGLPLASLLLAAVAFLAGCAGGDRPAAGPSVQSSAEFPLPDELEDAVTFWRNVYAMWGRDKVVIHDDRHLGLIYEVAALPGPVAESYTPGQEGFVRALTERWSDRLQGLEDKLADGIRLNAAERQLREQVETEAGPRAIFGSSERVRSQRGVRERFRRGLEVSGLYDPRFRQVFRRRGLPEDLAYLPHVESSFQLNARSSAGASGMWQFIRSTGRQYMTINSAIDERLDPVTAADAAARYLQGSYSVLRSWPLAITSYNHGVGGMKRAKAQYGDDIARIVSEYDGRYFGFASRNFYAEFLAARHVAQNAERYFPEGLRYEAPLADQPVVLRYSATVDELSRHYGVPRSTLVARNHAWLGPVRSGSEPVPPGSMVWLPQGVSRLASGLSRPAVW